MSSTLISGSTQGLGREIAIALARSGIDVVTTGRRETSLDFDHVRFDSSKRLEARKSLQELSERGKKIENLVCVVGSGSIREFDPELRWQKNFETNFYCSVILFEESVKVYPDIRNVVFISSIAGNLVMHEPPIEYSVAKSALNVFAKHMALRYAKQGMLINVIAPGNLLFPGSVWDKKLKNNTLNLKNYLDREVPTGRLIKPHSIAGMVEYLLLSNQDMTGQVICIDGGQSL
jgi:3-oxoacyl-[acyl-carrier protein] reductase